jgi:23S rRNA pseudouridine2605 synthase
MGSGGPPSRSGIASDSLRLRSSTERGELLKRATLSFPMTRERLQKVVARAGVASRRAAEELILKGRVRVNGAIVVTLGTKVDPRADKVEVDGRRLVAEAPLYLVLHKPRGVVSTVHDPEGRPTVRELLVGISERVFPVGRLDFHTSGALLLTNDGEFCDGLIHPKRDVPKTYVVKVQGEMKEADRLRWEEGVVIDGEKTRPAEVFALRREQGKTWLEVTLYEGRNQQIRKMGEVTGFPVMRLARISFAGITTEGLRPGEYRPLVREELAMLREQFGVPRRMPKPMGASATNVARGPAPRVRRTEPAQGAGEKRSGAGEKRYPAEKRSGAGEKRYPAEKRSSAGEKRYPAEKRSGAGEKRYLAERRSGAGEKRSSFEARPETNRSSNRGAKAGPDRGRRSRGADRRLTGRARPSTRKNGG